MIFFYMLVLMAPMPNHPLFEAPLAGLTVVKWIGIFCCGYAFFDLFRSRRAPAFIKPWEVRFFFVLFIIATLSFVTLSKTEDLTFNPLFMYFNYLMLFFTTIALVNTYDRLQKTLLAVIAGQALASLYVIREFQLSGVTVARPGYVTGDANFFATSTVLVMPLALYFLKLKDSRLQWWFCAGSLALMLIAFTLASSRGGLLGLIVAIGYMIVFSGHSRRTAIVIAVLLVPVLMFAPMSPLSRMLHPTYSDNVGAQIRLDFWNAGMDMIRNNTLTGIGLGNFTAQSSTSTAGIEGVKGIACNTFLEIAAELGIPGFLAYCGILIGALLSAGKLRAEGKKSGNTLLQCAGQAIQAGLLAFAVAAFFVSAEYQKPMWVMVAITAAVPTLLRDHRRRSRPPVALPVAATRAAEIDDYFDNDPIPVLRVSR